MNPVELVPYFDKALAYPELCGEFFLAVVLSLLATATYVALFAKNAERADRAYKIVSDILDIFRGRS